MKAFPTQMSFVIYCRLWRIVVWFAVQLPEWRTKRTKRSSIHYLYLEPVAFALIRKCLVNSTPNNTLPADDAIHEQRMPAEHHLHWRILHHLPIDDSCHSTPNRYNDIWLMYTNLKSQGLRCGHTEKILDETIPWAAVLGPHKHI